MGNAGTVAGAGAAGTAGAALCFTSAALWFSSAWLQILAHQPLLPSSLAWPWAVSSLVTPTYGISKVSIHQALLALLPPLFSLALSIFLALLPLLILAPWFSSARLISWLVATLEFSLAHTHGLVSLYITLWFSSAGSLLFSLAYVGP